MTDLSTRYGSRQRPRWFWPTIAAIGITLGVAFAAWVGFQKDPVTARMWAYDVVSDRQVTVKVDIVRPDPLAVTCTVYAQAADHAIVGEKTVDVPASEREEVRVTIDIETERRAVNGVLRTCVPAD
ncbi:DUF4307 domain-containing protein [Aeromicrobium wangtongii]|uniref:DUF4307 domain-containing protein n=1 Tax=Aeromicrobium wangtongii TaxID=2969247 RepID=A0ABY5MBF7_9ACTN|nr:DUF4307 domain-containing protein [Aeromicrobium wangtongii]MCD9196930.1 DUF4307 domain-containing protein [Aeromicrobium wangtongii]MCL3817895.1 DUF4307 domain-containing protein [Aeromicrobium wangtongii]UUP14436.1 DUF4307 domain-containing protein [Aeromicrobium wangtongii]